MKYPLIVYLGIWSIIIPVIVYVVQYRKLSFTYKLFGIILLISLIFDALNLQFVIASIWTANLFPFIAVVVYGIVFIRLLEKRFRNLVVMGSIILILVKLALVLESTDVNLTYAYRVLTSFWFMALSLILIGRMHQTSTTIHLKAHPAFWFAAGMLTYYVGNIFIFSAYMLFPMHPYLGPMYFYGHSSFNLMQNLMFAYALFLEGRNDATIR